MTDCCIDIPQQQKQNNRVKSEIKLEENACAVLASMFSGNRDDSFSLQTVKLSPFSQEFSTNDETSERDRFKRVSQLTVTECRSLPNRKTKDFSALLGEKSSSTSQGREVRQNKRQKVARIPQVAITKLPNSNEPQRTITPEEFRMGPYSYLPNGKLLPIEHIFPCEPVIMSEKFAFNQLSEFGGYMEQVMALRNMELFPLEYDVAGHTILGFSTCGLQNGDRKRLFGQGDYYCVAHPSAASDVLDQAVSEQMEVLLRVMGCSEASQKAVERSNTSIGGSMSKTWLSRKKVQEIARSYQFMAPKNSYIYMI